MKKFRIKENSNDLFEVCKRNQTKKKKREKKKERQETVEKNVPVELGTSRGK